MRYSWKSTTSRSVASLLLEWCRQTLGVFFSWGPLQIFIDRFSRLVKIFIMFAMLLMTWMEFPKKPFEGTCRHKTTKDSGHLNILMFRVFNSPKIFMDEHLPFKKTHKQRWTSNNQLDCLKMDWKNTSTNNWDPKIWIQINREPIGDCFSAFLGGKSMVLDHSLQTSETPKNPVKLLQKIEDRLKLPHEQAVQAVWFPFTSFTGVMKRNEFPLQLKSAYQ